MQLFNKLLPIDPFYETYTMKTIVKILFLLCISTVNIVAADYTISGKLMRKVTDSYSNTAGSSTDCDGVTTTLPSSTVSVTRLTPAVFSSVTIKVFTGDSAGTLRYTFTPTKAQIGWNDNPSNAADSGKFQYNLTGMAYSRFNYKAYVYLDGSSTSIYSEEFMLNKVPGIPVGTIWAYMGDGSDLTELEVGGWFLCDGRAISGLSELTADEKSELQSLFTSSSKPNPGNLPDLRGMFLRGMDKSSSNDPDRSSRSGGNAIGSYQGDVYASHNHSAVTSTNGNHSHTFYTRNDDFNGGSGFPNNDYPSSFSNDNGIMGWGSAISTNGDHSHSVTVNNNGGNETRPKNVYVNYIIKCRK